MCMYIFLKRAFHNHWPIVVIASLWFLFSSPYFFRGLVPFPSTYLVNNFPPWSASYGMPVKNNAMPDVITQIFPWKKLTIDTWKSGNVPLWNPYSFSGTPHAANYQSAVFSPMNLLFVLPFIDAWSLLILLQPLLAGLGMYGFLSTLKRSKSASVLGAVGFMFCGFITTWMAYGTLGYAVLTLPYICWCIASDFRKTSRLARILVSFFIAFSFVSGHFQMSLYVFCASLLFLSYETYAKKDFRKGIILLLYCFGGLLLVAPQLWLTFDAYNASTRSTSFIQGEIIPWKYFITAFVPDFFGNPVTRNDWFGHYAEWSSYVGIIPLLFAYLSLIRGLKGYKKYFFLLAAISLAFAYPTPLNDLMFRLKIPVISTSAASRIIVLFSFAFAALSSFGFDELRGQWIAKRYRSYVWFSGIVLVLFLGIWTMLLLFRPFAAEYITIAKRNLLLPSLLAVSMLGAVFLGYIRNNKVRSLIILSVIGLTCFDMYRFAVKWIPFEPKEYIYPRVDSISFLQNKTKTARVFGNIGNEVGAVFSLPLAEGYDAMYQGRYGEFINIASLGVITPGVRSVVELDKNGLYTKDVLQLLGIRYIYHRLSDGNNIWVFPYWKYLEDGMMQSIYKDGQYEILEYPGSFPRAYLASSYVTQTDNQKIIDTLFSPDFDRRNTLVLEEKPTIEPLPGPGTAEITMYKPTIVQVRTESQEPKLLYVSDVYDLGWNVTVDGVKSRLYRADYDFRAVSIPAGSHTVEFTYLPKSFLWGICITIITAVIIIVSGLITKKV